MVLCTLGLAVGLNKLHGFLQVCVRLFINFFIIIIYIYIYIYIYICIHNVYIYIYVHIHINMCVYIYIYIYAVQGAPSIFFRGGWVVARRPRSLVKFGTVDVMSTEMIHGAATTG